MHFFFDTRANKTFLAKGQSPCRSQKLACITGCTFQFKKGSSFENLDFFLQNGKKRVGPRLRPRNTLLTFCSLLYTLYNRPASEDYGDTLCHYDAFHGEGALCSFRTRDFKTFPYVNNVVKDWEQPPVQAVDQLWLVLSSRAALLPASTILHVWFCTLWLAVTYDSSFYHHRANNVFTASHHDITFLKHQSLS